jgi:hypothetical protein
VNGGTARAPRLNLHPTKTLTCGGASWRVSWRIEISRYSCSGNSRRCQTLCGASFALVWRSEEGGPNAEARDVLVIQVVIAIILSEKEVSPLL